MPASFDGMTLGFPGPSRMINSGEGASMLQDPAGYGRDRQDTKVNAAGWSFLVDHKSEPDGWNFSMPNGTWSRIPM